MFRGRLYKQRSSHQSPIGFLTECARCAQHARVPDSWHCTKSCHCSSDLCVTPQGAARDELHEGDLFSSSVIHIQRSFRHLIWSWGSFPHVPVVICYLKLWKMLPQDLRRVRLFQNCIIFSKMLCSELCWNTAYLVCGNYTL